MELRHLRYFVAVAERQNFTKAADSLRVAQSAVSQQIADLEYEIGVQLLARTKRKVSLTSAGRSFLVEARSILADSERAVERAQKASRGEYGRLAIGFLGPAVFRFLPNLVQDFRASFPEVEVILEELSPADQLRKLRDGEIDLGFSRPFDKRVYPELSSKVLYPDSLHAVFARKKGFNKAKLHERLAEEPLVLYQRELAPELFAQIVEYCRAHRFEPQIGSTPSHMQTVLSLVQAGVGASIVPGCVRFLTHSNISFFALKGQNAKIDLLMIYKQATANAVLQNFLSLIQRKRNEIVKTQATS